MRVGISIRIMVKVKVIVRARVGAQIRVGVTVRRGGVGWRVEVWRGHHSSGSEAVWVDGRADLCFCQSRVDGGCRHGDVNGSCSQSELDNGRSYGTG